MANKTVKIPPDERLVYLAFKNVFRGCDAQMRKKKSIDAMVSKHKNANEDIEALVEEHDINHINKTVKALLKAEIFESTLKAKIRFPELFDVSPAQSAERAASEAEAARTEAEAIREVTVGQQDESISASPDGEESVVTDKGNQPGSFHHETNSSRLTQIALSATPPPAKRPLPETFKARSLYPLYLPAKGQRRLLGKVQDILEQSCYMFGQRKMPDEIQKQDWDSADCVELNVWMWLFKSREDVFDAAKVAAIDRTFPDFLNSVAQIRHTAVHRLPITAGRVESLLADAEILASLLADEDCARQLSRLRRQTHAVVEDFGRNKDFLELQYMEKRKEIAARRAELDRMQRAAWKVMLEEDKQYQGFSGAHLEEIINVPETTLHSPANSDMDETSEEDTSVESEGEPDFCRVGESSRGSLSLLVAKMGVSP